MKSKHASFAYLAILLTFALPFFEFSCQGHKVAALNGYEAAFGTEMEVKSPMDGSVKKNKVEGSPLILGAFALAVLGAGVVLVSGRGAAAVSIVAAILLVVAQSRLNKEAMEEAGGMIAVNLGVGYWLTILLLIAGAILGVVAETHKQATPTTSPDETSES